MSLHHKSKEEEEGGMTSPNYSREHKRDETIWDSSAALGNSLLRPFWRHHQYFQPTKQSSVWCFLSMFTPPPCLAQSPVSQCSLPLAVGHLDLYNVPPRLWPHSFISWHWPPLLPVPESADRICTWWCSAPVQLRVSLLVAILDIESKNSLGWKKL